MKILRSVARCVVHPGSLCMAVLVALLVSFAWASRSQALPSTPSVAVIDLNTTVQPVSEWYLERGLDQAARMHASAVLIEMDTPGGLLNSMRDMVHSILASPVPVIVYVTPSGARAGSAGFFLLEAADVAAMAPGTNAGAAHPVVEGRTLDPIMKQKLENDATAFLRSYVSLRKRNVDAAQAAVLQSKSYSDSEAMQLNLITLVAPDRTALLHALDGKTVTRLHGETVTLHLANAQIIPIQPTLREHVLGTLTDPNIAVLLFLGGALLIYLEFNVPGTIIPGALGTLMVLTAAFALNLLPLRFTAIMLLIAALLLLLLEIKVPSHGVLAMAGVLCLVFGLLTLVDSPVAQMRVQIATAVGVGAGFGFITVFLIRIALRARRNKVLTGPSAMVGALAIAQQPLTDDGAIIEGRPSARGQVLVRGELWIAEALQPFPVGARLRVIGVRGLTLLVEQIPQA